MRQLTNYSDQQNVVYPVEMNSQGCSKGCREATAVGIGRGIYLKGV
jgi:hypothetical protein